MRRKSGSAKKPAEKIVRNVPRSTRKRYSAEEKIGIVLEGLRGEDSIAELCRREGIAQNLYYRWSKDFLEAGKKRLAGDTARQATSDEVRGAAALAEGKRIIDDGIEAPLATGLTFEQRVLGGLYATEDGKEGIAAFIEKRDPVFTGR